jgi:hypothetical protein
VDATYVVASTAPSIYAPSHRPTPDFQGLFRRRNEAESLNRGIEDSLYWRRAHSVGAVAQEADLLGFALGLNALSWHRHRHRRRERAPTPAAA